MIWRKREKLEQKYDQLISDKFDDYRFLADYIITPDERDESYLDELKVFKYVFSLGEEAQIYLWNKLYQKIVDNGLGDIEEEDFSQKELAFLRQIKQSRADNGRKYGKYVNAHSNINNPIDTERLQFIAFDWGMDGWFNSYFREHGDEYEQLFLYEFDDNHVRRDLHLEKETLSFVIMYKLTDMQIGYVALYETDSDITYSLELYILPEHRKRGFGLEAAKGIVDAALTGKLKILHETIREGVYEEKVADIRCISACISTENQTALNLIEKLNFELDGILRYDQQVRDKYFDRYIYSLVKP